MCLASFRVDCCVFCESWNPSKGQTWSHKSSIFLGCMYTRWHFGIQVTTVMCILGHAANIIIPSTVARYVSTILTMVMSQDCGQHVKSLSDLGLMPGYLSLGIVYFVEQQCTLQKITCKAKTKLFWVFVSNQFVILKLAHSTQPSTHTNTQKALHQFWKVYVFLANGRADMLNVYSSTCQHEIL